MANLPSSTPVVNPSLFLLRLRRILEHLRILWSLFKAWIHSKGYTQGAIWSVLAYGVSNLNDVLMRLSGERLDSFEVVFFRFLFSTLTLCPLIFAQRTSILTKTHLKIHVVRASLGFMAIASWCYAVTTLPLSLVTTVSFTVPLFVLPLAVFFLKEKVGLRRWFATIAGFGGILVMLQPQQTRATFFALILLLSAAMFALLDIVAKKMVAKENTLAMLFFFAVGTTLISFGPALWVWKTPTQRELLFLFALGIGCNLIQYCLLKAFAATDVSALAPFRYVELIISICLGWLVFNELPTGFTLLGAGMIIPAALYVAYHETRAQQRVKKSQASSKKRAQPAAIPHSSASI